MPCTPSSIIHKPLQCHYSPTIFSPLGSGRVETRPFTSFEVRHSSLPRDRLSANDVTFNFKPPTSRFETTRIEKPKVQYDRRQSFHSGMALIPVRARELSLLQACVRTLASKSGSASASKVKIPPWVPEKDVAWWIRDQTTIYTQSTKGKAKAWEHKQKLKNEYKRRQRQTLHEEHKQKNKERRQRDREGAQDQKSGTVNKKVKEKDGKKSGKKG